MNCCPGVYKCSGSYRSIVREYTSAEVAIEVLSGY